MAQWRYEERQHVPLWGAAAVVVGWAVVFGAIVGIAALFGAHADAAGIGFAVFLYVLVVGYTIGTNARRWIRIDDEFLRVGRRQPVPLDAIRGQGVLTGRPLRRMHSLLWWPRLGARPVAAMAALTAVGAADAAAAVSGTMSARSRYGVVCPFWARYGVAVYAPFDPGDQGLWKPSRMPDWWLIATRRPDELHEALQQACRDRPAGLARAEAPDEQRV